LHFLLIFLWLDEVLLLFRYHYHNRFSFMYNRIRVRTNIKYHLIDECLVSVCCWFFHLLTILIKSYDLSCFIFCVKIAVKITIKFLCVHLVICSWRKRFSWYHRISIYYQSLSDCLLLSYESRVRVA